MRRIALITGLLLVLSACGEAPLQGLGQRSAEWINEPEIVTTTAPPVTTPLFIDVVNLQWANEDIVNPNLDDPDVVLATVFQRREGDRFIQASREEIAAVLPAVEFPGQVPFGAEWISSQLVIENSGLLSTNPSAAFGFWSAEPYTRSRSVAQMAVLRVAVDPDGATEVAQTGEDLSCARFAERSTDLCQIFELDGKQVWRLTGSGGVTLIWFADRYRYELFGRDFLTLDVLERMASNTVLLAQLEPLAP